MSLYCNQLFYFFSKMMRNWKCTINNDVNQFYFEFMAPYNDYNSENVFLDRNMFC